MEKGSEYFFRRCQRRPSKKYSDPFSIALAGALWLGVAFAAGPLRIMPLGDSITEGGGGAATYRYWLQKDLEKRGLAIDFVGSQHDSHWGKPRFSDFDADHEGHWGWTSQQVRERIDEWAVAARPDVVLLHLGTNDLAARPEVIPTNLAAIIASLRKANPKVAVLVARLIPVRDFSRETLDRVNDSIGRMAKAQSTAASPVNVVSQDAGFDAATDTVDGVHPNEAGERKMARRWRAAILALKLAR